MYYSGKKAFVLIGTAISCMTACGDDKPTPTSSKATASESPSKGDFPATPRLDPDETGEVAYAYSPVGKRDPFKPIYEDVGEITEGTPLTPLQRYEVDQLRLIAIITGRATPYAMVEDPAAVGHVLTRGTLIGKNWGTVSAINPDCVVIKEEYRDYTGRKVTNTISMCLPREDEIKLE